jgi:hypothetical protein
MKEFTFMAAMYIMAGFTLEVFFTAISHITDGRWTSQDKYLTGTTYLWMMPVYGLSFPLIFVPLYHQIHDAPMILRYIVWAIMISGIEWISGYLYAKTIGFCPWNYRDSRWKIGEAGYTRWDFVPLWGLFGLFMEWYTGLLGAVLPSALRYLN